MRIAIAGYLDTPLQSWLIERGHTVEHISDPLTDTVRYDWIISYGFRHIFPREMCTQMDGRLINLHLSYLPWNRGSDPNLWSWVDDTCKGVTIHYVSPGLDCGDIISQRLVAFSGGETLLSSYDRLRFELEAFFETWPKLEDGTAARTKQSGVSTYHRRSDKHEIAYLLTDGHDTPVSALRLRGDD